MTQRRLYSHKPKKGNAHIEMDADGRIDVYSQKDISYHAEGDFNPHAKGNINMQADNGVQIKSIGADGIKVEATAGDYDRPLVKTLSLKQEQMVTHSLRQLQRTSK